MQWVCFFWGKCNTLYEDWNRIQAKWFSHSFNKTFCMQTVKYYHCDAKLTQLTHSVEATVLALMFGL